MPRTYRRYRRYPTCYRRARGRYGRRRSYRKKRTITSRAKKSSSVNAQANRNATSLAGFKHVAATRSWHPQVRRATFPLVQTGEVVPVTGSMAQIRIPINSLNNPLVLPADTGVDSNPLGPDQVAVVHRSYYVDFLTYKCEIWQNDAENLLQHDYICYELPVPVDGVTATLTDSTDLMDMKHLYAKRRSLLGKRPSAASGVTQSWGPRSTVIFKGRYSPKALMTHEQDMNNRNPTLTGGTGAGGLVVGAHVDPENIVNLDWLIGLTDVDITPTLATGDQPTVDTMTFGYRLTLEYHCICFNPKAPVATTDT